MFCLETQTHKDAEFPQKFKFKFMGCEIKTG